MTVQTRILDLVANPGVLSNLVINQYRTKNSLVASGVAVTGPEVDLLMTGGSQIQSLNFINKVDTSTFNYSSDDFDEKGATGKIAASPYMALRHDANWGWAYTDLTRIITKYDVKTGVTGAIPLFWGEVGENIAVASMKGALAAVPALVTGATTDAFDFSKLIDAAATMDDPKSRKTLFVSRKTFAKLQKTNLGSYTPMANSDIGFNEYAGYGIVITEAFGDTMTVIAQEGALAFSAGLVPGTVGMEIDRDPNAGNGGGGEILRTRLSIVAAPQGFTYAGAVKPGLATLATAAVWTKVVTDNSLIGFRAIKHAA
jgi:hypothetical protein